MEILFIVFIVIIIGFLVFDLGFMNKKAHKVSTRSAIYQSLWWVGISLSYFGLIWFFVGHELAAQFLSAYVTEKMLSVDNLFVIMLIFSYFKLQAKYQHKVLYWGILGAVIMRGLFITVGITIVTLFHWVLYFFGAFLLYTGIKLFIAKDDEEDDFQENGFYKLVKRFFPFTEAKTDGKLFIRENGKIVFTVFFMVLLLIETTDVIFAFDSIPAVFAITQNWFIAFTSNIFAVMGLRALFFLVEDILSRFKYMQKGISFVLIFIGAKMLVDIFHIHISSVVSLIVIVITLSIALIASLIATKNK